MSLFLPILYNTYELPENPNEYSVYIPKKAKHIDDFKIYVDGKWRSFATFKEDKTKQEDLNEEKVVSDKEYNLIKAIREYIKDDDS